MDSEFTTLYQKYKNPIFSYIFYLAGDRSVAEEICQDVFLKVYLNIAKFEGRSSLKTWIYTIARNTYFDYVRKTKKEVAIEDLENYTSDLVDKDMGPEEHATKIATRELIEKTLNQINEKYRMLLILRDIQNLSYKEISEITEMELNTVKVGIYRGRREFQKIYQEMEEL
ncbi:MAG: RNA polymerase sigma factor [Clostridia bacterium]|jgi:RNA polymerase sigma-70 factor (ECF subfamily)|nr:RNA polymerase sigma factor [Clostridia bacterium]